MNKEQKIQAILTLIQTDAKLLQLVRLGITNNIGALDEARIDAILAALQS